MKITTLVMIWIGMVFGASAQPFDHTHGLVDHELKQHVQEGLVNYRGLQVDGKPLAHYLKQAGRVSDAEFKTWTEHQQLAFLINIYNASTLQLILDHYPVKSIKKIWAGLNGAWDQPVVTLHGKKITLNDLEHEIIRKQYKDPRVHMALVCAAKGCGQRVPDTP